MKIRFKDDYSEGCHPSILDALQKENLLQDKGYGEDKICKKARDLILKKSNKLNSSVHFIPGGTQTNLIFISSVLKPFEAVICVNTSHINTHEAGAIEATGRRIEAVKSENGKLTVGHIKSVVQAQEDYHMVRPKLVYISNSSELGTVYNHKELATLYNYCQSNNLFLYIDGARIGVAIESEGSGLTLDYIASHCDAFYIGGTKNGALLGEALVINTPQLQTDFIYNIKQRGGLLAKGRLMGIQFLKLFEDNLYFDLAKRANSMANRLRMAITQTGRNFLTYGKTNQIFPIFHNTDIEQLKKYFEFYTWSKIDKDTTCIRLVTSWATRDSHIEIFETFMKKI